MLRAGVDDVSARVGVKPLPVVVLSTADMSAPIWTNKQHIAVRLVHDREVHYIESMGLRSPGLGRKDLGRIASKILSFVSRSAPSVPRETSERVVGSLVVHAPLVVPFHGSRLVRAFNKVLVDLRIKRRLPSKYVLWSFSPLTYGLEVGADKIVYHSVDLLHTLPGIPARALLAAERKLITRADHVIASSTGVLNHLKSQGREPLLWENVADVSLFESSRSEDRIRRAIFVGNLTPTKIDFEILEGIVASGVRLALAGPMKIDGAGADPAIKRLLSSPIVTYLGVLTQREMAIELGRSWVGLVPYLINDYTTGVFPMKVYEYLAAGLSVVSSPLPSLVASPVAGVNVVDAHLFADMVTKLIAQEQTSAIGAYGSNSWEHRLDQIRELLAVDDREP